MKTFFISSLIGLAMSLLVSFYSFKYIQRQSSNDYLKKSSAFYESLEVMQSRIDDLKMTSRAYKKMQSPIALIAIDDASIDEIGRWPWSRTIISELTNQVLSNGAKSLTFDLLNSEPERENPDADRILGESIKKYADQVILGTATSSQYPANTHPYQDICTSEAFLYLGGDKIVTLNPTFVVDDQTETFETYKWKELFESLFAAIAKDVENQFLASNNKLDVASLSQYQKNSLISQKGKAINTYCFAWLTNDDYFLKKPLFEKVLPLYEAAFETKLTEQKFSEIVSQLKKAKAHPIPQYLGWYSNTALIQDQSKFTASFKSKMDSDGLIRRYPLFYRAGSKIGSSYIPSLAMQTYLVAKNYRAEIGLIESKSKNEKEINFFKIYDAENDKEPLYNIPIDSFAQIRLNYYGPENSFYYVSAKELLTKDQNEIQVQIRKGTSLVTETVNKKDFFKDKSVFIGATALGIFDVRNTPVQNALPGTEIHLTALANLMERNFIRDLDNSEIMIPLITLILGILFSLLWAWGSALVSLSLFIVSAFVLVISDYLLFSKKNYLLTNWSFFAVFLFTFTSISLYKYFTEERNKHKVRKAFSKYVSPTVVEELLKSEKNLELGGQKKNLTVLFSDLRGFTSFSEKLEPKALSDFLNIYLTRMTEEIYKTNGTVDKFIGDAIMAFYGAPVAYENHAQLACRCALQSIRKLELLNDELKGKDFPKLEMGIGINTGEMSVGNMGSATIQNYTVMGDSVNLASRLEGLTRLFGNHVVLGPLTYEAVRSEFQCREIDQVVVKGKTNAIKIYDLLYQGPVRIEDQDWLMHYNSGRDQYTLGQFEVALSHFNQAFTLKPSDKISQYYIQKCTYLIQNPPSETWTSINHLREK